MKNIILLLISSILFISCSTAYKYEYPENAFHPNCLEGPIRKVRIYEYKIDTIYGEKASLISKKKLFYDRKNKVKKEITSLKNKEGQKLDHAQLIDKISKNEGTCDTLIVNGYRNGELIEEQSIEFDANHNKLWVVRKQQPEYHEYKFTYGWNTINDDNSVSDEREKTVFKSFKALYNYYYNNSTLDSLVRYEKTIILTEPIYDEHIREAFYYNVKNELVKRDSCMYPWGCDYKLYDQYTFDKDNNLIESYRNDMDCETINNEYVTKFTPDDTLSYRTCFDYDSFGNNILVRGYGANGGKEFRRKEINIRYRQKPHDGVERKHGKSYYRRQKRKYPNGFYF